MDFNDIVLRAMDKAIKASVNNSFSSDLPQLEESLQKDIDLYRPMLKYVNTLVVESLRIYHEQASTRHEPDCK